MTKQSQRGASSRASVALPVFAAKWIFLEPVQRGGAGQGLSQPHSGQPVEMRDADVP
ncbi:hypothetical protein SCFA_1530003 [anaerobic digester metagenome]|uniref:Uncharacterized protein n=1 Tax=anaerobic digester metagenome TaxID=1263854 RepID=A0A485M280_9ZZZZ